MTARDKACSTAAQPPADAPRRGLIEGIGGQPDGGIENRCGGPVESGGIDGDFEECDAFTCLRNDDDNIGDLPIQHVMRAAGELVLRIVRDRPHRDTIGRPRATGPGGRHGSDRGAVSQPRQEPCLVVVAAGGLNKGGGEDRTR